LSVVSYAPVHSGRQIRLAVAATFHGWARTADRPSKHGVRDCIRYRNALKLFVRLRRISKSVTARFATLNPVKKKKKSKYARKQSYVNPSNTQNTGTRQRHKHLSMYCTLTLSRAMAAFTVMK